MIMVMMMMMLLLLLLLLLMLMMMMALDRGQVSSLVVGLHFAQRVRALLGISHLDMGMLLRGAVVLHANRRSAARLRNGLQM